MSFLFSVLSTLIFSTYARSFEPPSASCEELISVSRVAAGWLDP